MNRASTTPPSPDAPPPTYSLAVLLSWMGESVKTVCATVMIVAGLVGYFIWNNDGPAGAWAVCAGVAAVALAIILLLHSRRDRVRDYLVLLAPHYFNCEGLCFAVDLQVVAGVTELRLYYQNQFSQSCHARVGLKPQPPPVGASSPLPPLVLDLSCDGGALGVLTLPLDYLEILPGSKIPVLVTAAVQYPQGKGRRLRFRDGTHLYASALRDWGGPAVHMDTHLAEPMYVGSHTMISLVWPGAALGLPPAGQPAGTSPPVPPSPVLRAQTLWQPGDPPWDPLNHPPPPLPAPVAVAAPAAAEEQVIALDFRYTSQDWVRALRCHFATRLRWRLDLAVMVVTVLGSAWLWGQAGGRGWAMVGFTMAGVLALLVLAGLVLIPWWVGSRRANTLGDYQLTFAPGGIHFRTTGIDSRLLWSIYTRALITPHAYLLYRQDGAFSLIPTRIFASAAQEQEFARLVQAQVPQVARFAW